MILYNTFIRLFFLLINLNALFHIKARKWIQGRKNQHLPDLSSYKVLWMHCSSLGEFEQGRPVFEKLKKNLTDHKFVLTFFSPSGYEFIAKREPSIADHILYFPLDTQKNAENFIEKINPEISIFVKYDFWYNFISEINKRNLKLIFISVLLKKNHSIFSFYFKPLLNELKKIKKIFTQDKSTLDFLHQKGFNNIEIAGDTRIDRVIEIANSNYQDKKIERFLNSGIPAIIFGSTWTEDINVIGKIGAELTNKYKLIIAPHELSVKNFRQIELSFKNNNFVYYSNYDLEYDGQIMILDTIGILKKIYKYGKIAYIGGGFGSGIHNTLEPGAFGLPVIFGPKYKKFIEAKKLVDKDAFFSIKDHIELSKILLKLEESEFYNSASSKIKTYFIENKNASEKVVNYILNLKNE